MSWNISTGKWNNGWWCFVFGHFVSWSEINWGLQELGRTNMAGRCRVPILKPLLFTLTLHLPLVFPNLKPSLVVSLFLSAFHSLVLGLFILHSSLRFNGYNRSQKLLFHFSAPLPFNLSNPLFLLSFPSLPSRFHQRLRIFFFFFHSQPLVEIHGHFHQNVTLPFSFSPPPQK